MAAREDFQIIYPFSETLPLKKARAIQYVKTCYALAELGIRVHAIFGKDRSCSDAECLAYYGLKPHPNLTLWRIPILRKRDGGRGLSWNGLFNHFCVKRIKSLSAGNITSILYLRHIKLAYYLHRKGLFNKVPTIFEAHEVFSSTTGRQDKMASLREMEEAVLRSSRTIVSISHGLKGEIEREFGIKAAIPVIPDGADYTPDSPVYRQPEAGTICYTGHLYPWKGVDTLVRAMAYLPDARLSIVGGEDSDIARLKKLAGDIECQNRITFAGWVPPERVAGYLEKAAVAVIPLGTDLIASQFTSPLKLFEYMAAGVPIVASDLPSVREVLTDSVNAVLVRPDDPEALAEGIRRILDDGALAQKMATQALGGVQEYSWRSRAEKIVQAVRSVL